MAEVQGKSILPLAAGPAVSDEELCRAIKAADEHAFKQLYYRYYEALFKFAWRRVQETEAARGLVQTIFIRLWNSRERLDEQQSLKSYLYRIATNLVIDHIRQKGQVRHQTLDEIETEPSETPDETFELEEVIDGAIAKLPEALRTVFKLSRFNRMKNGEIAEHLGISIKTVESRMTKALTILRDHLKPFLSIAVISKLFSRL